MGDKPRRMLIGLASRLCLCGSIEKAATRDGRQAMFYRLEEHVPVSAEEMWADFLASDFDTLGICAVTSNVEGPRKALADAGIAVAAVCPTALLALQHAREAGALEPGRWDAVAWRHGADIELFFLRGAELTAWHVVPDDAGDVGRLLFAGSARLDTPLRIAAIAVRPELLETLRDMEPGWKVTSIDLPFTFLESATATADAIAGRRAAPMVDLRTAESAGDPWQERMSGAGRVVAAAFVILCTALIVAMTIRGIRYQARTADADNQTRSAYAMVFPNSPIPLGIESRLSSTYRSLGMGPTATGNAGPSTDPWLLSLLNQTLEHLPAGVRFNIDSLRLEDRRFVMEGHVLSIADAAALAAALRKSPGLIVDDPQTQRTDSAVALTLSGRTSRQEVAQGAP
jgi:hypothetical protein